MGLSKLDKAVADAYAPQILAPVKYGENGVVFWFPGSGMTSIVTDVFSDKQIITKHLGQLAGRIKVFQFWGHLANKKAVGDGIRVGGFSDYLALERESRRIVEAGYEVVCVLGRIDSFPESEKIALLRAFIRLNSINRRRVHILFHTIDKPWFERAVKLHPELISLANCLGIAPVINGSLLETFIQTRSHEYGFGLTPFIQKSIIKTYGGILQLTKEYIRAHGNISNLELKLKTIWSFVPAAYKTHLVGMERVGLKNAKDLREFGVAQLTAFIEHARALDGNPNDFLPKLLTSAEQTMWSYCQAHVGEQLPKDLMISLLRPDKSEQVTLWSIDQAVSRFRKKLALAGIEPTTLKTVKGKGYIWKD